MGVLCSRLEGRWVGIVDIIQDVLNMLIRIYDGCTRERLTCNRGEVLLRIVR